MAKKADEKTATPAGPQKHPGGRPTDYRPEYCAKVIELGKGGASKTEMASEFGVTKQTILNWEKEHEEFFASITQAMAHSQAWWEKKGRECLIMPSGVTFQASVWSRSMAARFPEDWREKTAHEMTGANDGPIQLNVVDYSKIANPDSP